MSIGANMYHHEAISIAMIDVPIFIGKKYKKALIIIYLKETSTYHEMDIFY